ncbi:MAG: FAD-dependent oxidoreductase [Bacillota bacterium]|nr:FAD-dependent oxidoreductase [Bacillota bacterium]
MKYCDVVIIGGGPGGLAAAKGAREAGARSVLVLEREDRSGGILNQCIHDGFGLVRYKTMLTGPEYALRARQEALNAGAEILTGAMVTGLTPRRVVTAVTRQGLLQIQAGAAVLATGCRERTRGAIAIPGSRPAGVYTAGTAQNLMNTKNLMVGKKVVILGSGDIGLIMARRLILEGAQVLCAAEMNPVPSGLERNVSQCLYDFGIPLYLRCTVTNLFGKKRLEGVELSQLDEAGQPIPGSQRVVACDTLLLSVGLIPENEVAAQAGVALDPKTNGAVTDKYLQTSVPGVFACGNSRKVLDLADFVTVQGLTAGRNAAAFLLDRPLEPMPPETSNAMAKGLPQPGTITCILCPKGCRIQADADGKATGNGCPKGEEYALQEQKAPKRVLTTTLKRADGSLLPVKTSQAVPRDHLLDYMDRLRNITLSAAPLPCGTVVLRDPFGIGADVVSAQ